MDNRKDMVLSNLGDGIFHPVFNYEEGIELKNEAGYIKGDFVYLYRGKFKKGESLEPGVYIDDNDNHVFVDPVTRGDVKRYNVANIIDVDTDKIIDEIINKKESFISLQDSEILISNSDVFVPTIKDTDDPLKKIIKQAIIEKRVNLSIYKNKVNNEYGLVNMKSALLRDTAMSIKYFKMWLEVLDLDFRIILRDNGDPQNINPLKREIVINSDGFE